MRKKEFVMRGQTESGKTETLNFGTKDGYAHRMTEFVLYPSANIPAEHIEAQGSVTAGKTAVAPTDPNFNDEGLIAVCQLENNNLQAYPISTQSVVNDTFLITQDLILMVQNTDGDPVNWQCRFVPVKMSESDKANANYRQFMIFDE